MQPLIYLFQVLAAYFLAQLALAALFRPLTKRGLGGLVMRSVYISCINHVLLGAAAYFAIRANPAAAKMTTLGIGWAIPLGLVLGLVLFVILDVGTRIIRRRAAEVLVDLEEIGLSPAFPKYISIPGATNYFLLKPFGEELFLRAFMLGILSTAIHPAAALLMTVIVENLRYPQLAWAWRNTVRALILGAIFFLAPTIVLPLVVSLTTHLLQGIVQLGRVNRMMSGKNRLTVPAPNTMAPGEDRTPQDKDKS